MMTSPVSVLIILFFCFKLEHLLTSLGLKSLHLSLFPQNLHHMYRAYGGWTFAFKDYLDLNVTMYLDDPRFEQMAAIVDPYGNLRGW